MYLPLKLAGRVSGDPGLDWDVAGEDYPHNPQQGFKKRKNGKKELNLRS